MNDLTPSHTSLKHCPSCKQNKPATSEYFAVDKRSKIGLRSHCKVCVKNRYNSPEKKSEYDKKRRAKKRDQILAQKREYYAQNKERILEKDRQFRIQNREDINRKRREKFRERYRTDPDFRQRRKDYAVAWRAANPELCRIQYVRNRGKIIARVRQWVLNNPERARLSARSTEHRRRALKRDAKGNHGGDDIQRQYNAQKGRCY